MEAKSSGSEVAEEEHDLRDCGAAGIDEVDDEREEGGGIL